MEKLRVGLDYAGRFVVNKEVPVSLIGFSQNHIDVSVYMEAIGTWRLTGFYGCPNRGRRRESWLLLQRLSQVSLLL